LVTWHKLLPLLLIAAVRVSFYNQVTKEIYAEQRNDFSAGNSSVNSFRVDCDFTADLSSL
jgi:hypothetical protein